MMLVSLWLSVQLAHALFCLVFFLAVMLYIGVLKYIGRKFRRANSIKEALCILVFILFAPIVIVPGYMWTVMDGVVPAMNESWIFATWAIGGWIASYLPGIYYFYREVPELRSLGMN